MGVDLKYNLDDYNNALNKIRILKDEIQHNKQSMISGLQAVRNDWTSEGGVAFFSSVDDSWSKGIDTCVTVLEDMIDSLEKARAEYEKIEPEANKCFSKF